MVHVDDILPYVYTLKFNYANNGLGKFVDGLHGLFMSCMSRMGVAYSFILFIF